jgi:hypothetical protein
MNISAPLLLETMQLTGMRLVAPNPGAEPEAADLIPDELREWLVRLRLLHDVPFAYFVADTQLLPEESIRWFYVDRRWTDALVQGALSVGTVNTDDRLQLTDRYDEIRDALDTAERNVRRRDDDPLLAGTAGPISGFILRSRAVSGWPGLHVRAFKEEPIEGDGFDFPDNHPKRMRLLRLERLAPAVLLCLFDGIPKEVHIQEPRQGVQFGVNLEQDLSATLLARDPATAKEFSPDRKATVHFRPNAPGVVDIQQLERELVAKGVVGLDPKLDSAEYALQLIRFPYRQIYGQPGAGRPDGGHPDTTSVLKVSVRYVTLASELFTSRVTPP